MSGRRARALRRAAELIEEVVTAESHGRVRRDPRRTYRRLKSEDRTYRRR